MLPLAMLTGALSYRLVGYISFLTPYLIFTMLLLTFCKLSPREMRLHPLHKWLLLIQLVGRLYFFPYTVSYFYDAIAYVL